MTRLQSIVGLAVVLTAGSVFAAGGKAFTNARDAGPDFQVQGEYQGKAGDHKVGIQVIALGKGKFDAVVYVGGLPGDGWKRGDKRVKLKGETDGETTKFSGEGHNGEITDGVFRIVAGDRLITAKKVERKSPTLGKKPLEGATILFDGSSADGWEGGKIVEEELLNNGTRTKKKFANFTLHLEFRTPFMPESRGQGRGNSGMYLLDQYECQILDSFGLEGKNNECGGIYSISEPNVNACFPPLSWQTYDVEFTAAKFDADGKKTADALATIRHNGIVIHDRLKLSHSTPGGRQKNEVPPGALYLQNHGNPVHFRNIWIIEK